MIIKKKNFFIFLTLLIIILPLGYYLITKQQSKLPFESNAKKYQTNLKKPKEWPNTKIAFPAYESTKILEGADKLYIALQNPSFNKANLKYIVYLDDEKPENLLLETDLIQPGKAITEVPIPKNLTVGEHTIYIHTKAYAPTNEQTKLNSVNTSFGLSVIANE